MRPRHHEQRADRLEDLAAALDAGLGVDEAFAAARLPAGPSSAAVADRLRAAVPELGAVAHATFAAAETAGTLPDALRELAAGERRHAARAREVLARLAYPVLLVVVAIAVIGWLAFLGFTTIPPVVVIVAIVLLAIGAFALVRALRRARHDPGFDATRLRFIGTLAADAAATPYLEAMRRLHGAGVRIDHAHELATRTCPLAAERARLTIAGTSLGAGTTLADALEKAGALDAETRQRLAAAERIGGLEEAFAHLAGRRRAMFDLRAERAVKVVGAAVYAVAAIVVALVVTSFYGGLYARLRG